MMRTRTFVLSQALATTLLAVAATFSATTPGEAHKAITSKYSFNEDMFPLFREHCGRCHVDGGVAPMSLLTHDDAAPWAESLRLEFLSEDPPPPWHTFKLTAREFDMVLVWANGGTPRGDVANAPAPMTVSTDWVAGPPQITLKAPEAFTLAATVNEASRDVQVPVGAAAGKTVRAIDVLPGNPAILRQVALSLKSADGTVRELAVWTPGRSSALTLAAPLTVPAGASVVARLDYKRTWKYEGQALTDDSVIGLYTR